MSIGKLSLITGAAALLVHAVAANADVSWPAGQLLPSLSAPRRGGTFSLPFSLPAAGHALELRVLWMGNAYIKVDYVEAERSVARDEAVMFASLKGVVNAKQPRISTYEGDGGRDADELPEREELSEHQLRRCSPGPLVPARSRGERSRDRAAGGAVSSAARPA